MKLSRVVPLVAAALMGAAWIGWGIQRGSGSTRTGWVAGLIVLSLVVLSLPLLLWAIQMLLEFVRGRRR